jgi:predicted amidophosphoribosyltransferase
MRKNKAVTPMVETEYAQPMVYLPVYCPVCNNEVPYRNYCCECGQKLKEVRKNNDDIDDDYV